MQTPRDPDRPAQEATLRTEGAAGRSGDGTGALALLRENRGFRLLFSARVISLLGDWFALLATIALLREVRGSSAAALSGMFILKLLPIFLAGPLAGVVADRFSRKRIMVTSDVVRAVLVLGLIATPLLPRPVGCAYALILLQVIASAFFEPARAAALPQLVPDRWLATANAVGAMAWSMMFAIGSALGGLVTSWVGWRAALVVDAGTYVLSAWLVARLVLPRRERRPDAVPDWQTLTGLRDFRDGIAFIRRRPPIATVLLVKAGWGIGGAIALLLTLFGERIYTVGGRADLGVGLLFTARAVGTGIGPWLARRIVAEESPAAMRWLLTVSFVWPALCYIGFSWASNAALATLCVVLAHLGGSVLWVYSTVLLQRMSPTEFAGRVMATDLGMATLTISASMWVYGMLAEAPGADLRLLVRWLALTLLLPGAIWFAASRRWPVGRREDLPGSRGDGPDA